MWKGKLQPHIDICHLNNQLKNQGGKKKEKKVPLLIIFFA